MYQLRAVTLRHCPVLPALRDPPGSLIRTPPLRPPTRSARPASRTRTQAAPSSSAWNENDSQARATNPDASDPAEVGDAHQPGHEEREDLAEDHEDHADDHGRDHQ